MIAPDRIRLLYWLCFAVTLTSFTICSVEAFIVYPIIVTRRNPPARCGPEGSAIREPSRLAPAPVSKTILTAKRLKSHKSGPDKSNSGLHSISVEQTGQTESERSISVEQTGRIEPEHSISIEQTAHMEPEHSYTITMTTPPEFFARADGDRSYRNGDYKAAVEEYRKLIGLGGARPDDYLSFADALYRAGELSNAIEQYKSVIALTQNSIDTKKDRQMPESDDDELQFELTRAFNNLGVALDASSRYDEAIDQENRAISRARNFAEAHYNLGCALEHAGKHSEAVLEFKEAAQYASTAEDAKESLSGDSACKDLLFDIVRIVP